jgi:hypothetical protein
MCKAFPLSYKNIKEAEGALEQQIYKILQRQDEVTQKISGFTNIRENSQI